MNDGYIKALGQSLPSVFAGTKIDKLTGGAYTWKSIRTRRSRQQIPEECFGPRLGARAPTPMIRDPFLRWVETELRQAKDTAQASPASG